MGSKVKPFEIEEPNMKPEKGCFISIGKIVLILIIFSVILTGSILATYFGHHENHDAIDETHCRAFFCRNPTLISCRSKIFDSVLYILNPELIEMLRTNTKSQISKNGKIHIFTHLTSFLKDIIFKNS